MVRAPACHAGGREFDPRHSRHFYFLLTVNAQIAQSVEQGTENPRVSGSIPLLGTIESLIYMATSPSGKAEVCKISITSSNLVVASK